MAAVLGIFAETYFALLAGKLACFKGKFLLSNYCPSSMPETLPPFDCQQVKTRYIIGANTSPTTKTLQYKYSPKARQKGSTKGG